MSQALYRGPPMMSAHGPVAQRWSAQPKERGSAIGGTAEPSVGESEALFQKRPHVHASMSARASLGSGMPPAPMAMIVRR
jgi:hypothetical protein